MNVGDLVKLRGDKTSALGIVVAIGEEKRRMYGDGIEYCSYADVKWLNKKYPKTARFSPPQVSLEVFSAISRQLKQINKKKET